MTLAIEAGSQPLLPRPMGDIEMRTLLMMDSDQVFLHAVERTAPSLGFSVFAARSKSQFQELYRRHAPEVILIGIVIPEVDGFEIAAWLCEEAATARLILVSAHSPLYAKWITSLVEGSGGMSVEILHEPLDGTRLTEALEGQARPRAPETLQGTLQEESNGNNDTVPPSNA